MKKAILTFAVVMLGLSVTFAQTEKGSRLAGVHVGNIVIPTSGNSTTIIGLQPAYGWFVSDGLVVGAGIPFFHINSGGSSITQIGLAPFLRYYIGPSQVKPYFGGSVGVINTSVSGVGSASSTDALYGITGGIAFFINRSVSFDLALTYTGGDTGTVSSLVGGNANTLTPNIPKSLNINLGFQVYFGR